MKKPATSIFQPAPGQYRPYRFPPLLGQPDDDLFGDGSGDSFQDDFNNGFEEGQQKGFEQGYEEGMTQGTAAGQQQGLSQGQQQGFEQGVQQAQAQVQHTLMATEQLQAQIQQAFHQHVRQQSEMLCDLVQKVARQVIRAELTLQPSQLVNLIEETLTQIPEKTPDLVVHLNPQDKARLTELVPEKVSAWKLEADDTLTVGSCRVVCQEAEAVADSEERLEACMESVRESLLVDA